MNSEMNVISWLVINWLGYASFELFNFDLNYLWLIVRMTTDGIVRFILKDFGTTILMYFFLIRLTAGFALRFFFILSLCFFSGDIGDIYGPYSPYSLAGKDCHIVNISQTGPWILNIDQSCDFPHNGHISVDDCSLTVCVAIMTSMALY